MKRVYLWILYFSNIYTIFQMKNSPYLKKKLNFIGSKHPIPAMFIDESHCTSGYDSDVKVYKIDLQPPLQHLHRGWMETVYALNSGDHRINSPLSHTFFPCFFLKPNDNIGMITRTISSEDQEETQRVVSETNKVIDIIEGKFQAKEITNIKHKSLIDILRNKKQILNGVADLVIQYNATKKYILLFNMWNTLF